MSNLIVKLNVNLLSITQRTGFSVLNQMGCWNRQLHSSPCNVEELAANEMIGFSATRHRDLVGQITSVFGSSFMSDQMTSQVKSEAAQLQLPSDVLLATQNYEPLGSIHLDAITQQNVPQPFSSSSDQLDTHLNMSMERQQLKYTANDLHSTMYPGNGRHMQHGSKSLCSVAWMVRPSQHTPTYPDMTRHYYCTQPDQKAPAESRTAKLKRAVSQYGPTVIVIHILISLTSVGICYTAVASGLDVAALLSKLEWTGLDMAKLTSKAATGTTTFVMAYAFHKMLMPFRVTLTLACAPLIVRYLRRIGLLKKPPASKGPLT